MGAWFRTLGITMLTLALALSSLGCGGIAPATLPLASDTVPATQPVTGTGALDREAPVQEPERGASTTNLTGKWFGSLAQFDPAEPPMNSWNIDLELVQEGHQVSGVVIISELIPIAANIWDVYIRLDASTHGQWHQGQARLHMFQDVRAADAPAGLVVNPRFQTREMEYVEAVITGVTPAGLDGYLVIHWRNPYDYAAGWTQVCRFVGVSPVAQGSGSGGGGD